jgi:hypothetical protein
MPCRRARSICANRSRESPSAFSWRAAPPDMTSAGGASRSVISRLLERVGFTDHALERFAARAGIPTSRRDVIEPIVRDLLLQEGRVVDARPHWARSQRPADLYLQLGEWMLFIGCRQDGPSTQYAIVTVVNGPEGNTWRTALRRGYIFTPPPPRLPPASSRDRALIATLARSIRAARYRHARARAKRRHQQRYRFRF